MIDCFMQGIELNYFHVLIHLILTAIFGEDLLLTQFKNLKFYYFIVYDSFSIYTLATM